MSWEKHKFEKALNDMLNSELSAETLAVFLSVGLFLKMKENTVIFSGHFWSMTQDKIDVCSCNEDHI